MALILIDVMALTARQRQDVRAPEWHRWTGTTTIIPPRGAVAAEAALTIW
jgi:hypothetical protein